jgi:hypothetical protein
VNGSLVAEPWPVANARTATRPGGTSRTVKCPAASVNVCPAEAARQLLRTGRVGRQQQHFDARLGDRRAVVTRDDLAGDAAPRLQHDLELRRGRAVAEFELVAARRLRALGLHFHHVDAFVEAPHT